MNHNSYVVIYRNTINVRCCTNVANPDFLKWGTRFLSTYTKFFFNFKPQTSQQWKNNPNLMTQWNPKFQIHTCQILLPIFFPPTFNGTHLYSKLLADPACLSRIPDPTFFHPESDFFPSWIRILTQAGCSSRIRILIFYPSRIPDPECRGQKGTRSRIRNTGYIAPISLPGAAPCRNWGARWWGPACCSYCSSWGQTRSYHAQDHRTGSYISIEGTYELDRQGDVQYCVLRTVV